MWKDCDLKYVLALAMLFSDRQNLKWKNSFKLSGFRQIAQFIDSI